MNWFCAVRGGYGALVLARPDQVVRLYSGQPARGGAKTVVRLLGARHVVQAVLTLGSPTPPVLLLGAEADVAHALSAGVLAILDRPRRRAGIVDAAVATAFAVTGTVLARQTGPPQVPHGDRGEPVARLVRWRDAVAAALAGVLVPSRVARGSRRVLTD